MFIDHIFIRGATEIETNRKLINYFKYRIP